ncbi:hypothetical protein R1flu_010359 [Riccia fluitans]|uniref:FCP1 homology domain-containing protein n=1 Tax=Riccia fluitans TaxID=41844 RepID=A0ABD1Z7S8_9MARC
MHDQSNLQEVVAKLKQEVVELQTKIDEKRVELVSIQELETQVNLKSRELVTLQANIDSFHENAAAGTSLFRPMPIPPDIPRQKTLILDLNGVLCKIERSATAFRQAKDLGTERNIELVLEALDSAECHPPGVKSGQSHFAKVEGVSLFMKEFAMKDGFPIFVKDFATLEFWNISIRDVLMIDDSPEKGMTNFPYSVLYPPTFTPLVTSPDDDTYLNSELLQWL